MTHPTISQRLKQTLLLPVSSPCSDESQLWVRIEPGVEATRLRLAAVATEKEASRRSVRTLLDETRTHRRWTQKATQSRRRTDTEVYGTSPIHPRQALRRRFRHPLLRPAPHSIKISRHRLRARLRISRAPPPRSNPAVSPSSTWRLLPHRYRKARMSDLRRFRRCSRPCRCNHLSSHLVGKQLLEVAAMCATRSSETSATPRA